MFQIIKIFPGLCLAVYKILEKKALECAKMWDEPSIQPKSYGKSPVHLWTMMNIQQPEGKVHVSNTGHCNTGG